MLSAEKDAFAWINRIASMFSVGFFAFAINSKHLRLNRFRSTAVFATFLLTTTANRETAPVVLGSHFMRTRVPLTLLPLERTRATSSLERRLVFRTISYTVRRARPLCLRLVTVFLPAVVALRALKPCVFARLRRFG